MLIIRPISKNDLDGLMDLLTDSGHGLTSLPKDRKIIESKILTSQRSFDHRAPGANGESYLFVMENLFTGKIVGVSGIISKIGGFEPYYFYKIKEEKMNSKMLGVSKTVKSLHIETTHSGPAEICSLFLAKEFRNSQNGRFLSLSRFLFMASDRNHFEDMVIAEMRGKVNQDGHSPFWDAVGNKFMDIDFVQADCLTLKSKKFIDELLPKYPILVDLLPKEAQEVIGQVHEQTEPAKRILEQEGFKFSGRVGIFEPGPVIWAYLDEIRTIKESQLAIVSEITNDEINSDQFILSSAGGKSFIACLAKLEKIADNKVRLNSVAAQAMKIKQGDEVRYVTLRG